MNVKKAFACYFINAIHVGIPKQKNFRYILLWGIPLLVPTSFLVQSPETEQKRSNGEIKQVSKKIFKGISRKIGLFMERHLLK